MRRFFLFFIVWVLGNLFFEPGAFAIQIEIKGYITNDFGNALMNHPVQIHPGNGNNSIEVYTDQDGFYEYELNFNPGGNGSILVYTWALCFGNYSPYYEEIIPQPGTVWVNFQVCSGMTGMGMCVADFFPTQHSGINNIQFFNTSHGNNLQYLWDFGDGNQSTQFEPMHHYDQIGVYEVSLDISSNGGGCFDSHSQYVFVGNWNGVYASITANGTALDNALGFVFQVNPISQEYSVFKTNSLAGNAFFSAPLVYDNYILVDPAIDLPWSYFPKYFPTYYGNALQWQTATGYNLLNQPSQIEIDLQSFNTPLFGQGKIQGTVIRNDPYVNYFISDDSIAGSPISISDSIRAPLFIYLLDETGTTIDYRAKHAFFNGEDGPFEFNDLPFGSYTLRTEMFKREAISTVLTIDSTHPVSPVIVFNIEEEMITLSKEDEAVLSSIQIFPNPVRSKLFIRHLPFENASINLYDNLGRRLRSQIVNQTPESSLEMSGLKPGTYYLHVYNKGMTIFSTIIQKK